MDPSTNAPPRGSPLQLVRLNKEPDESSSVVVDKECLDILTKKLKDSGAQKVAVVSVMGAFRTGKSFLLDLMLRYLRYEASCGETDNSAAPPRGSGAEYPLPAWITSGGATIEGGGDDKEDGFRFKGGMDSCTEGIWVWSEPFLKKIDGAPVALLLMDTQGAWDGEMTKEQSATIFGLTAVLSSKQVYNINMMISEDKVENLTYFMQFAQTAIQRASVEMLAGMDDERAKKLKEEIEQPFQSLDFLARDWRNFKKDWTVEQCRTQMEEHKAKFLDPAKVKEKSTAEVLNKMFRRISCFCLPHPGFAIQDDTWNGAVADIEKDFIRMVDIYVREVFNTDLQPKKILGSELSPSTFHIVVKDFVESFHDAAPAAMGFTQAMRNSTVLLAKEQAMKTYTRKMDDVLSQNRSGTDVAKFEEMSKGCMDEVKTQFSTFTIFGGEDVREDTWQTIEQNLQTLYKRYKEDNSRLLEKALAAFANITIIGSFFFVLDRLSDYTCDWWSNTCVQVSRALLLGYVAIFGYIGVHVYFLVNERGRFAAAGAAAELWKEMMRLLEEYCKLFKSVRWAELPEILKKVATGKLSEVLEEREKKQK